MSDRIRLRGLTVQARHGVLPEERTTPQPFVVDVDLDVDLSVAGASDDLVDTVDYGSLARDVADVLAGGPVSLVETLAEAIARVCLARPTVEAAHVTVHKPQAPLGVPVADIAVEIHREASRRAVVALGANLGRREVILARAVRDVAALPGVAVRAVSDLVETDPVGGPPQPPYLNAVLLADTRLHPRTLLAHLQRLEAAHGRRRGQRWGPRTLDLDLIAVGDPADGTEVRLDTPQLVLPHPRAHGRAFVLLPWLDVDPGARLRVGEGVATVADLVAGLPADLVAGVRPGPGWGPA